MRRLISSKAGGIVAVLVICAALGIVGISLSSSSHPTKGNSAVNAAASQPHVRHIGGVEHVGSSGRASASSQAVTSPTPVAVPSCANAPSSQTVDLSIDGSKPVFSADCFNASSASDITLRLDNELVTLADKQPISVRPFIVAQDSYTSMVQAAPAPGVSGNVQAVTNQGASYSDMSELTSGSTLSVDIGKLVPGVYTVTAFPFVSQLDATITVS